MNVQAHLSGQVPNQGGLHQQNGNMLQPSQMQNLGVAGGASAGGVLGTGGPPHNMTNMDPDLMRTRDYMRGEIIKFLKSRQQHPITEASMIKFQDFARRLEEGLFKIARTKEDYTNLSTLEQRLQILIRGSRNVHSQRHAHLVNSASASVGTMIPTPGMSSSSNPSIMVTSSIDTSMSAAANASIAPTNVNTGSLLRTASMNSGCFGRSEGNISNGYQQSAANFLIASGGMSSSGVQRMASQMIPTPGFNSNNNSNCVNNQSNNVGGLSTVESTLASQPQQQKQHGGQNSRILHTLGSQMGSSIRSGLQQKTFRFSNGSLNGALEMMGNNMLIVNESGTSGGYQTTPRFANSPKPLQQQHQQTLMQGDGYGMNNTDCFGPGNFYGSATSVGSMMNSQNSNPVNLQSISRTKSSLISNPSNLHGVQLAAHMKSQSMDQFEKMNIQPPVSSRDNILQANQLQQFQQHPLQFQQQQFQQQQPHHQQNLQHQNLPSNSGYSRSQMASNIGSQVKHEPGVECHDEVLHQQDPEQYQLPELQSQFQGNQAEEISSQQNMHSSLPQNSQQMQQMLPQQQLVPESQNDYELSAGALPESAVQTQWHPHSQEQVQRPVNMSFEQHVQEDFQQRISGQDEAQCNNLSLDASTISPLVVPKSSSDLSNSKGAISKFGNQSHDRQFRNQVRWLLLLRHARRCNATEGKCDGYCFTVRKLLSHMDMCVSSPCSYPRCHHSKILIRHHKTCRYPACPVCVPVNNYVQAQKAHASLNSTSVLPSSDGISTKTHDAGDISSRLTTASAAIDTSVDIQPSLKRMKREQSSQSVNTKSEGPLLSSSVAETHISQDIHCLDHRYVDRLIPVKSEPMEVKTEVPKISAKGSPVITEMKDVLEDISKKKTDCEPITCDEFGGLHKQENAKIEKEPDSVKLENFTQSSEGAAGIKSGKPNIKGVSLTELFTPEQVQEHIKGLRQWVGQSKSKAEKHQAMEHSMSENSCQLCAVERLTFEPPPIYCSHCGGRIKRNATYYTVGAGDTRHYFCIPCHNDARGDSIVVDGTAIPKARLEKKKNDEEIEEWWVQCDKCEVWQHQICALFNGRRNDGGQAEYTCPNCYIAEVERGERETLPQSAVLGAKDLPRTILSDHIEQRLFKRLKQERQERAKAQGKSYDEVPGAEALVVRVVSSVDKKLEVKPRFLEIFQEENYPLEFPYKSKVVLLFQKIEGVEVCLFGMYVQEFGAECAFPNQRRVYLSYLDSVKYFRPEVKSVTGEALRTFVYHEILIGYLEYCKKRGFTSCYIWACPPLKGEDYIIYCHPEIQKTPKSDKLREWYLAMLRKASKENVVVELTNLYDHFFVTMGERKAKVTAARLPYFDGDYWPGAAEDLINQLCQEDGRKINKKGTIKKTTTKRALKASSQSDLSSNASKDLLLMHKLGETISPMKEDFIMVHLQHCCTHCCVLMVAGNRWVCNQCKNVQICDKCYETEQKRDERERHPINHREKHVLYPVEITDVPTDTEDKDEILESEFFDTRQAFLSLCQGNHYQYDTLRRAKHSSMMVLYHLHNPTAPAFVTTCNVCHLDIETGQGWRCEVCPDYDVCNSCYHKDGCIDHPHKLTNHPSVAERDAQNKEARQLRVLQLRKMLDLLVHASQCRSAYCQYPNCRKVKGLFRHGIQCKKRASGGCVLCKKMWYLLQLHARACKESECHVPRCSDLKEHLRRLQQQSDSRRRAAVMEMMRQRAAEVAGNSG
ncbi:histone acetyltransferase HAC1-like [Hibiscus syriacus]|uniref:histone acetyltransferase HAC1-like n=1 Tax=Hibiscus syriacus TaxID=106335 RepID=UPI00192380AA|nr:histone acetyltransferase HAC1-like [Hibiscus syriacus]XP_039005952.1 histone acetyltransferase HAC1-like [Hibiscus syriacus]